MLKRFWCIFSAVIMSFSVLNFSVSAEGKPISDENAVSSLTDAAQIFRFVGKQTYFGAVNWYDYNCYKDINNTWYMMAGKNLTSAVYHSTDTGSMELAFSEAGAYNSESASSFSTAVSGGAGGADMIKAAVGLGCGISRTVKKQYSVSSVIPSTIPIGAETGYYKIQLCYDFNSIKVEQIHSEGIIVATNTIAVPYGESYAAVLYSPSNTADSWKRW